MDEFCGSVFWDIDQVWNTTDPDFTLCFKITILVWVPCAWLWLLSPLDIYYMKISKFANIPWSFLNIFKFIIIALLLIISIIDFAMSIAHQDTEYVYNAHIVAAAIKIITFIYAALLTYLHKKNGIHSSGVVFLFWLLLCVCGIPQYRSEIRGAADLNFAGEEFIWNEFQFVSYMIYFPLTVFILIASCFADKEPQIKNVPPSKKPSPELRSSYLRNLFFQWFDPVVWRGYRKPLETDDMFDINPEDASSEIVPRFDKFWLENVEKNRLKKKKKDDLLEKKSINIDNLNSRETNGSILMPMTKAFGGPFLFAGFLKLIIDLLAFASPQLLNLLITFTATPDAALWKGLLYAFLLFLLSIFTSLLNGQYFFKSFLVGFRIRSGLISAIYRKALKISSNAKKTTTVGEIVNLMAVDAQRFFELMAYLHILWSGPLVIALALYFLWQQLGPSVLSGLAVMILLIPLNGFIAAKMKSYQVKQMQKKDERVKLMNEILNGIKVLKLYAWEESFQKTVQEVRDIEMTIIRHMAYYNAGTYFLWTMAPFLVSLASFATFVLIDENNVLNANVAFVSLSLFNILRMPMIMFPMMITFIMQAWVSIVRINKFMNNEELDPKNVTNEKSANALSIENGTFTWGEKPLLHNINLKVPKGDLCAIVGPVGTGKSSIISAMLGEMEKLEGSVNLDGTLAFVPQQAWIQNSTVQDNILFGKPMNREFYNIVLESCALIPDLKMLPGGDQTEIGEKGINLSGGQKQRISMARAVYNNAEIYLLDDPLSAVDSHVGKHIFDKVIGPTGLLAGKTVLLVTHGISYLPKVNNIFVMLNGEITESGHYDKLIEQKGAFADFILQHLQGIDDDEELNEIKEVLSGKPLFERAISLRSSNSDKKPASPVANGVRVSKSKSQKSETAEVKKEPVVPITDSSKLIQSEDSATGSVSIGVYIRYFKSIGLLFTAITIIATILNQAFSVYSNTWLSDWAADPNNTQPAVRNMYLGVYGGLGGGQAISLLASSIVLALGCLYAARDLHNRLLKHSFRLPMSFFDTTPLGRIMNRFSKDVDMVDNTLPMSIRAWILMFFTVCAIFVVISISTPIFMSVIVPIAILYYFIQKFYVETSRQLKRLESVTRSPIYSHFGESITGQSTIRAYNVQERFIQDSTAKVDFNQECTYPSIIANRWLGVRLEIVGSLVILFAALFAVLGREALTGAIVGLSISYSLQITQVLSFLVRMTAEVETNIVAIERIEEYAELETEAPLITKKMDPAWPQNGEVNFKEYKVRYRDGLDLVLKGISFSVKGGEKVGIVGRTGAGKSSLTLSLFRLIEAADGKIIIDGENIAEMGLHSLRSRLTIIPQDPVLFSGTLRMNVDPFSQYRDDEIWLALQHAHLKAYVKGLSEGLSHVIAEGGENLSVGQRQLVCLARALLRKTKILILDEATAAVDLETDDLIQKTIRSQFSDCTILTIAHRLNTIMDSDRIIVLDAGYVAEYDTPKNLLHNKDSIFYGMAKSAGLVN